MAAVGRVSRGHLPAGVLHQHIVLLLSHLLCRDLDCGIQTLRAFLGSLGLGGMPPPTAVLLLREDEMRDPPVIQELSIDVAREIRDPFLIPRPDLDQALDRGLELSATGVPRRRWKDG